jgi:hypothetical protein
MVGSMSGTVQPAVDEGAAREPKRVRAGEGDEVVGVQALADEAGDQVLELHHRRRDAQEHVEEPGDHDVAPAGGHGEAAAGEAAGDDVGVARREGDNVGAGDDAGARGFHGGLDLDHGIVPAQRDRLLLHRRVGAARVQQDGRVAALNCNQFTTSNLLS